MYYKIVSVFVYIVCVCGSGIYNENTKVTFIPDVRSDLFGFSVVFNRYGLLVGAPKAKSRERGNPLTSGLVFNCSLNNLDSDGFEDKHVVCNPFGLGVRKSYFSRITPDNFFRDDMWYGASIASLTDEKLLICAPRFTEPYSSKHLLAHGVCFLRGRDRDSPIYPLSEKARQAFMTDGKRREYGEYGTHLNFYAYGQAGISVKVVDDKRVIIGAPGLLQWTGGILQYIYSPKDSSSYFSKQVVTNPYYTQELGPDDYFGYSVESGFFLSLTDPYFVGGAPRAMRGYGQVLIFEPAAREQQPLKVKAKVHGPQLGSYFGASLCCLDVDGDGLTDILLVGAPNYVTKDGGLPYDQGAVFVYRNIPEGNNLTLKESGHIYGSGASGARFGTVIADLGDVDGDGYRDVAIGAPWENNGSGVVYIYRGFAKGIRSQYAQMIMEASASSFGISISKGMDVDGNNCNDLAIGAAKSSTVYLYRCVPTITVNAFIKVPDAMNLPHNATGFTALFCVKAIASPLWSHVKADFNTTIVIDPEENRAMISGDSHLKVSIMPGKELCEEQTVDVKPTADLSKPISMKFFLKPDELMKNDSTVFNTHAARVSEDSVLETSFLIQLVRDCGEDMICTPWLEMTFEAFNSSNPYIPGTKNRLGATLTILNKEEPAYGATVNITLPMVPKRLPSACSLDDLVLMCDVPAPLLRHEEISWDIELEYKENVENELFLKMKAELSDPLYNRNITNESVKEVMLEIMPIGSFNVAGKPLPNDSVVITREYFYENEEIEFSHFVEITNFGPSNFLTEFSIALPAMVNLSSPIESCEEVDGTGNITVIDCTWYVLTKVSRTLALPLRFDLVQHGEVLKQNTTLSFTTEVVITNSGNGNRTKKITTTLILDPAPPIWPLILGVVSGLILLAAIVYLLHRYGFFSRQQRKKLKELQEQQVQPLSPIDSAGSGPSFVDAEIDESTQELLYDSD